MHVYASTLPLERRLREYRPMKAILRHAHEFSVEYAKNNVWHFLRSMCCCCWCCRRSLLLRDYDNTVSPSPVHTQRNAASRLTLIYLLAANKRRTYIIWEHVRTHRTLKTKIVAHFLRFSACCVLRLCITRRAITKKKKRNHNLEEYASMAWAQSFSTSFFTKQLLPICK